MLILTRREEQRIIVPVAFVFCELLSKATPSQLQQLISATGDAEAYNAAVSEFVHGVLKKDEIVYVVNEIKGDRVKVGIDADRSIPVHREEVYQDMRNQGQTIHKRSPAERQQAAICC